MEEGVLKTEARFAIVVQALCNQPGITHSLSGSTRFDSSALKIHDKIFAMLSSAGRFVVKLPEARVVALVLAGAGQRFDANRGGPMKEWLEVHSESAEQWLQLAREALEFVGT